MRYREFFRIDINHQYFLPGEPAALVIVPDPATKRFLKGQHFLIKEMTNGIRVLVPVDEEGSALPVLQADDLFTFKIFPTSHAFHSFTEITGPAEGEILSFTNSGLSENDTELASSVADGGEALHGFPVVATVEIRVSDLLLDADNAPKSPRYNIVFSAKAAQWKYYLISDPETTDLSIQDGNEQLVFNSVELQDDTVDEIIASLRSNFPDANLFLFESETPVAFRSQPVKKLQLRRNEEVIINNLPNPDVKDGDFKIIKVYK